jgi:hypothetical protein
MLGVCGPWIDNEYETLRRRNGCRKVGFAYLELEPVTAGRKIRRAESATKAASRERYIVEHTDDFRADGAVSQCDAPLSVQQKARSMRYRFARAVDRQAANENRGTSPDVLERGKAIARRLVEPRPRQRSSLADVRYDGP